MAGSICRGAAPGEAAGADATREAGEDVERTETRIDRDLLDAVRRRAVEEGRGEEELIEEAVGRYLRILRVPREEEGRPWPRYPLYSGDPTLAEKVDEELAGGPGVPPFGEH